MNFPVRRSPSGRRVDFMPALSSSLFQREYENALSIRDVFVFSHNPNASAGVPADIWTGGGLFSGWLTAPSRLRVRSGGNAADSASGAGARTITLRLLDENFRLVFETLTLAGASASAFTTGRYMRLQQAVISTCGSYANGSTSGANAGDIIIESEAGVVMGHMGAGHSSTQRSMITVPAGHSFWFENLTVDVTANQPATVTLYSRDNANIVSGSVSPRIEFITLDSIQDLHNQPYQFRQRLGPMTDIWGRIVAGINNTAVSLQFSGLVIELGEDPSTYDTLG